MMAMATSTRSSKREREDRSKEGWRGNASAAVDLLYHHIIRSRYSDEVLFCLMQELEEDGGNGRERERAGGERQQNKKNHPSFLKPLASARLTPTQ